LVDKIIGFADRFDMFPRGGMVLACVSGGVDSMCMLDALLEISEPRGFAVAAAHYNHKLRGDESDRDEAFVAGHCAGRGVECHVGRAGESIRGGEDASRKARYAFFEKCADGLVAARAVAGDVRIATAHTADDNAETMLMNLARGAGSSGLSGIPPRRGRLIRPLLGATRAEVLEYASMQGIPYVEDSTNKLDAYTRNRLRHTVVPVLKSMNPHFLEAATVASELLREDERYIASVASKYVDEFCADGTVDADALLRLPFAVSSRVIRQLYGGNLSYRHVRAVLDLCAGGRANASLSLPAKRVLLEYGRMSFCDASLRGIAGGGSARRGVTGGGGAGGSVTGDGSAAMGARRSCAREAGFEPIVVLDGVSAQINGLNIEISCKMVTNSDIIHKSFNTFLFDYSSVCGKITVRPRREGDSIRLAGRGCTKTLKKLFIERRIPARERPLVPVVADDCGVLAVYGVGCGDRAAPKAGEPAIMIEFIRGEST
jgi:tRNA(Ile)-lysidine synthase